MSYNKHDIAESVVMVDAAAAVTGRPARVGLRATVRTIAG